MEKVGFVETRRRARHERLGLIVGNYISIVHSLQDRFSSSKIIYLFVERKQDNDENVMSQLRKRTAHHAVYTLSDCEAECH